MAGKSEHGGSGKSSRSHGGGRPGGQSAPHQGKPHSSGKPQHRGGGHGGSGNFEGRGGHGGKFGNDGKPSHGGARSSGHSAGRAGGGRPHSERYDDRQGERQDARQNERFGDRPAKKFSRGNRPSGGAGREGAKNASGSSNASSKSPRSKGASRGSFVELPAIQPRNAAGYPKKQEFGKGHGGGRSSTAQGYSDNVKRSVKPMTANRQHGFQDGKRPYDYAVYEREPATPEYLARLFAQHHYDVCGRELEAYWQYYDLLRTMNAELDLTRIMGIEATVLKHFIDSSIIADMTTIRGPLLDIGSGPGFPGAPIAIRRPDLPVILAESRGKRVRFLELVKEKLDLRNVTIFPRSVREDSEIKAMSVISRALESIPGTLQRVKAFLPAGGRVLFLKGPNCGQEVTQAQEMFKGVYKMAEDIRYDLPASDQSRRLIVFERRES